MKLDRINDAISRPGSDSRILRINGDGGLGKTRLLYETLWRTGHPTIFPNQVKESWNIKDKIIVSDVLDFSESKLHTFDDFIERLRESFNWHIKAEFPRYDSALSTYRRRRKDHVDFGAIKNAGEQARQDFFRDYRQLAKTHRLVWVLDTIEQLLYPGAPWLKTKVLLDSDDLDFSTREQIIHLLENELLPNTTILLAGRPSCAEYYNELISRTQGKLIEEKPIDLRTFSLDDTKNYLLQLEKDFSAEFPQNGADLVEPIKAITSNNDRIEVLYRYTGGKPVLLALFTDLLVEGVEIPEALQDTLKQAESRLKEYTIEQIQFEIEAEFINLIFYKTGDIRSRILTALVRARRGLDLERLAFYFGSKPDQDLSNWQADPKLRHEISAELDEKNRHSLRYLSFVKRGYGGRLILQDELYRIYDQHMAIDTVSRQDEILARKAIYTQLHDFAKGEIKKLKNERNKTRKKDEDSLVWTSPAEALSKTFRYPGRVEEDSRIALEEQLLEAELERLHYKLRLRPIKGIFDKFADTSERQQRTGEDYQDLQVQIELWRFAQYNSAEEYWRNFLDVSQENWPDLEQIIAADDVNRWIRRFFTRGHYARVVAFVDQVDRELIHLDEVTRNILRHPFFSSERRCWREFGETYLGLSTQESISNLQNTIKDVEQLLVENFSEENKFGLDPDTVKTRLYRILGVGYNDLGYSLNTKGQYRESCLAYTRALRYLRGTDFRGTQALVRNNLSRVLSELGLVARALRICRDGLSLREELGYEAPIAGSHSTLALIYNNGMQPENAWVEAAMAVAYFRKLESERGHGLALFHLAEALRRLASTPRQKLDSPDRLFQTAMEAIDKAVEIFKDNPEKMRLIEVSIEQGCLYRDYMYYLKVENYANHMDYFNDAVNPLKRAITLAKELGYLRHQLDAQVDLAWTYYYASHEDAAERAFHDSLDLASQFNDQSCFLSEGAKPPEPNKAEPHMFMLLGKAWALMGQLHMDRFIRQQETLQGKFSDRQARVIAIHKDKDAQKSLKEAAKAFVLALAYNKLYSARSPSTPIMFDRLYEYLKKFNRTELWDFSRYQKDMQEKYRVSEITPTDLPIWVSSWSNHLAIISTRFLAYKRCPNVSL
jgi:tetratricopeptide (TPR) repeat protein